MQIFNTLSQKKEEFKTIKPNSVLMYHCGPTVYWTQHIGNMRAMVWADLIVRTLRFLGYNVKLVRNYTDVGHLTSDKDEGEDKMEIASKKENLSPEEIAKKYINIFEKDVKLLNTEDPELKPKATDQIKEVIEMIEVLLKKGYAYSSDLAIYFDVSKAKDYEKLSRQKLENQIKDAGKAEISDSNKKNPQDFVLWFFKAGKHKNALQSWESPFSSPLVKSGEGFPGWHIECSVITKKFLGDTIDIHMGGIEHIPIHHTNEIAQSESANSVKYVNYWIHNEHLLVNNEKMSKSEGTSYSLQEVIDKGFDPLALRYFFLQANYRSKQNFTWEALGASENAYNKLKEKISSFNNETSKSSGSVVPKYLEEFKKNISDGFGISNAVALMWELIKDDSVKDENKKATLLEFDKVFGLGLNKIEVQEIPQEIKRLAQERELARKNKEWEKADELRKKIENLGYEMKDTKDGFNILKK